MAFHDRKKVVEVVRHPSREHPDGLHLLGVEEPVPQPLPLGLDDFPLRDVV